MRGVATIAICAGLLAGCGGDQAEESPAEPGPVAETELSISVDADGEGGEAPREAELACRGAEAPREACLAIEQLPDDPAAEPDPATPCTEIYGGADIVTISGTLEGEPIDTSLTRENGCAIDRFDRFAALLEALFPGYQPGSELR